MLYQNTVINNNNLINKIMATRSNIAVVVKPEDFNRPLCVANPEFAEVAPEVYGRCGGNANLSEVYNRDIFVDAARPVLQIYVHNDGYPEGVGEHLLDSFNSYEQALALVLCGDLSSIGGGSCVAYSVNEGYTKNNEASHQTIATEDEEYLYVFADGEWRIDTPYGLVSLNDYINGNLEDDECYAVENEDE